MTYKSLFSATALAMLLAAGCTETVLTTFTCAKDVDCPGQLICQQGRCVNPDPCVTDEDCGQGALCLDDGSCVAVSLDGDTSGQCVFDKDCPAGYRCNDQQVCVLTGGDADADEQEQEESGEEEAAGDDDPVSDLPIEESESAEPDQEPEQDQEPANPDDRDSDTILNADDNCPDTPNQYQEDADDDGVGDACDNCPGMPNHSQANRDGDLFGDACDPCPDAVTTTYMDTDVDGRGDECDNCPRTANADQANQDSDDLGDICDPTPTQADACAVVQCHPLDPRYGDTCANFGLSCKDWSFSPGTCTMDCSLDTDCPAPYGCQGGRCVCTAPDPQCLPSCGSDNDCPGTLPTCSDRWGAPPMCTTTCATSYDCPSDYTCADGWCYCGDGPAPQCIEYQCSGYLECAQYNLSDCIQFFGSEFSGVCTTICDADSPCPGLYTCVGGYCRCAGGTVGSCPAGQCSTKEDCWNLGYSSSYRCLVTSGASSGYCSLPCATDLLIDSCPTTFGSSLYQCQDIGSGNGTWCVCTDSR